MLTRHLGQNGPARGPRKASTFELPGLTKEKVHIDVKEGVLRSVSGERDENNRLLGARGPLWQPVLEIVAAPPGHQGVFLRILHNALYWLALSYDSPRISRWLEGVDGLGWRHVPAYDDPVSD